jgi:hypothetical protein
VSLVEAPVSVVQVAAEALAACLCEALADGPELCFCGILPGAAIPIDVGFGTGACGGMAYVRVAAIYPSAQVGVANLEPANCDWGTGFDLEMGVYRPFPINADGSSPDPDVQLEMTRWQMWDAQQMRKALCCDWLPKMDYVVGQYAPAGPAGGVLGGIIPISAIIV